MLKLEIRLDEEKIRETGKYAPESLRQTLIQSFAKQQLDSVMEPDGTLSRLIHQKNGSVQLDRYIWNTACNSDGLREKVQLIRQSGKWGEVRQAYLSLKNQYLCRNDLYHPSFICYIEAVNQVYCTMTNKTEYVTWAGSLTRK